MTARKLLILIMLLSVMVNIVACTGVPQTQSNKEYAEKIDNTEALMKKQPGPKIEFSMDRYLIGQRLIRFNDPNKMTYLYVVLPEGTWLQVTIIGKLASTTKRLTRQEQAYWYSTDNAGGYGWYTGQAPDEMAVYGSSEPAKIGMSTLGSMLEIGGFLAYIYSETPLMFKNLNKPVVEMTIEATPEEKVKLLKSLEELKRSAR